MKRVFFLPFILLVAGMVNAQTDLTWQMPPRELVAVVDAPLTPSVFFNPSSTVILLMQRPGNPSIEDISAEMIRLGGIRIDPAINAGSRPSYFTSLEAKDISSLKTIAVTGLPDPVKIQSVTWSPDGKGFALVELRNEGLYLWYVPATTYQARQLSGRRLNGLLGSSLEWMPDGSGLLAKLVPENRGSRPVFSQVPAGPVIQENDGEEAAVRTYQDLLSSPQDIELFDYFTASELYKIALDGTATLVGAKAVYTRFDLSPDGKYITVSWLEKPYSYLVPWSDFPTVTEIWSRDGVKVADLFRRPLMEAVPTGYDATSPGPRGLQWRADAPATLIWTVALDEGDPKKVVEHRDQVMKWEAPFTAVPASWIKTRMRYGGITWGKEDFALISEGSSKTRQRQTHIFNPSLPVPKLDLLWDLSSEDRYNNPGSFVSTQNEAGRRVLLFGNRNRSLYLESEGASPAGNVPYLDEFDLKTRKSKRLWQSEAPWYESVSRILDTKNMTLLTSRQSVQEPSNYYIRSLKDKTLTQVTHFANPYPFMAGVNKEIIRYRRDDGVELNATLYTPAGWKRGDAPLPTLLWAYPREFKSRDAAGQISGSPFAFTRVGANSAIPFVTQGYAVIDNAAFPIIGEGEQEPNDEFISQLVANAKAAIDHAAGLGVTDPKRVAVGGHSYGAFMTANLLAHCDLFAAGIARSGAYNRTLTPFGFQSEPRTYWEAPEIYFEMSPFSYAHKVKDPILLIHGMADNNSGTFPVQSERYYAALKGHGATVRLVFLPLESHGYVARESLLHMLWEMNRWLDLYVK